MADDTRAPARWQLLPTTGAPGDDPEAGRGRAGAGDTDRSRPADPASHRASPDADLRSGILRVELRLPTETFRPWSAQAGTSPYPGGLPHRRRSGPGEVLRQCPARYPDGPCGQTGGRQAVAPVDRPLPAGGRD